MPKVDEISSVEMLSYFSVGQQFPNVYVLGSLARYVTLYSQQVRALNLVGALLDTRVIKTDSKLLIIGAGAAGLTASAAAALAGVNVTLLEQLEHPMELQSNNRQRFLHPRIYDWPAYDDDDDMARLPILNWKAAYAEAVSEQLFADWAAIKEETGRIKFRGLVQDTYIPEKGGRVTWNDGKPDPKHEGTVILAVGFGLDETAGQNSYWSDDDLDDSLRRFDGMKYLVVGHGDGALTDVMRLAFRRFRHSEILELFRDHSAIQAIKDDLLEIHGPETEREAAGNTLKLNELIHDRVESLDTRGLQAALEKRLRKNRPVIRLTGRDGYHYAPRSSVLNRWILRLLMELGVAAPIRGPVEWPPTVVDGKFRVKLKDDSPVFERVIYRAGPKPVLGDLTDPSNPVPGVRFHDLAVQCDEVLRPKWRHVNQFRDPTRVASTWDYLKGLWPRPRLVSPGLDVRDRLKLHARAMTVSKEIRDNGNSAVNYRVEDLVVREGEVEAVRFLIEFTTGYVGRPELDAAARQIGATLSIDEPPSMDTDNLEELLQLAVDRGRKVAGSIEFNPPLGPDSPPASFGLKFDVVSGDALTSWEFDQLYKNPTHINRREPAANIEHFARTVIIPVETLSLRLTLPELIREPPFVTVFQCSEPNKLTMGTVAPYNRLQLSVLPESPLSFEKVHWKLAPELRTSGVRFTNPTARTWEAVITKPPVGTIYSIDFRVPQVELSPMINGIARDAKEFRTRLLRHRNQRLTGKGLDQTAERVREQMGKLANILASQFGGQDELQPFNVTLMTYDDEARRLVTVDGVEDGGEPSLPFWNFWLPFGVGVAGACFKQLDRQPAPGTKALVSSPVIYVRPKDGALRTKPEAYVPPLRGKPVHEVLIAIPLDHPRYDSTLDDRPFKIDLGRHCVGVVSFGSSRASTRLYELSDHELGGQHLEVVLGYCEYFRDKLYEILFGGDVG